MPTDDTTDSTAIAESITEAAEGNTASTPIWYVYMVECADGTYYTGITTDPVRRTSEHNGTEPGVQRGARYTRARRPVALVYTEQVPSRSEAARREWALKRLSRQKKTALRHG
ncbi:MAG: GIY-YIG nuclease family protein [Alcanivorax sp.]|nr:GIY-YIG nuclease family protein [Alcanivorax sp.]